VRNDDEKEGEAFDSDERCSIIFVHSNSSTILQAAIRDGLLLEYEPFDGGS